MQLCVLLSVRDCIDCSDAIHLSDQEESQERREVNVASESFARADPGACVDLSTHENQYTARGHPRSML